jgi:hypothetical protein
MASVTKYPGIFAALAAPFDSHEVKVRTQGGRQLHYITARTAMNRLDTVLGPENWWDEYVPGANSVMCRLTVVLPDGRSLTKMDAGGYAGMADSGDDDKSGFSDAFKRAAAKFGVARYLYRDGVPQYEAEPPDPAPEGPPAPRPASGNGKRQRTWGETLDAAVSRWVESVPLAEGETLAARKGRILNGLITDAIEAGKVAEEKVLQANGKRDRIRVADAAAWLFGEDRAWVVQAIKAHLDRVKAEADAAARAELGPGAD